MRNIFIVMLCCISVLVLFQIDLSIADDMLTRYQLINDDSRTLVSAGGKFQLGFFSPGNSKNRYLGIWYSNIPTKTIVWVANRENPLNDSLGVLKIGDDGNLILLDQTERVAWSTNIHNISSKTTVARLLDSGNLVLRDESKGNVESFLWQSFDHPSDTMLAGMKLGWDLRIGLNRYLTSWKSADDPSPGEFSYSMDNSGIPQFFLRKSSVKLYRNGLYDFVLLNGTRSIVNSIFDSKFIINSEEVYFEFSLHHELTRVVLTSSGAVQRFIWSNRSLEWVVIYTHPRDPCDYYNPCGSNAICTLGNNPQFCSCLAGYMPKSPQEWDMLVWSGGCIRKNPLNCPKGEGFLKFQGVKIPDLLSFRMNTSINIKECEKECLKNCSCTAFANSDSTERGTGCLLWYGNLADVRRVAEYDHQHLYIRVTASDLEFLSDRNRTKQLMVAMVTVSVSLALFLGCCMLWKRRILSRGPGPHSRARDEESLELPIFNIITVAEATNNFSNSNKIGAGGFGSVYKGQLSTGQVIAVKKLSENSKQGLNEFKNEVTLIAILQHRNLVRLLGCCIEGEEKMLIYEYMPNGSLDSFIFDNERSNSLAWKTRFDIIVGIARGLLYLHRDSRLQIIHRDLKASNVLLDREMNPKISDFGIARIVGGDQIFAKTRTVVGTYGYMSPEYIIKGLFSMKSDVFSFGVLVLEIVTGLRNIKFRHPDHDLNLLGHAWKLWIEGKAIELLDPLMEDSFPISEVLRCIQVGLLCVQQCPEDRPKVSSVLLMLDSESAMLPQPRKPGFYAESSPKETELLLARRQCTTNKLTNTLLEGR